MHRSNGTCNHISRIAFGSGAFGNTGAIVYDQRTLSFRGIEGTSLLTLSGRIEMPLVLSDYYPEKFIILLGKKKEHHLTCLYIKRQRATHKNIH